MIREYAVDPTAVAELTGILDFLEYFGIDTGRMISGFIDPVTWIDDLLEEAKSRDARGEMDQDEYRAVEAYLLPLRTSLGEVDMLFLPPGAYRPLSQPQPSWIDAALKEHKTRAFDGIIGKDPRATIKLKPPGLHGVNRHASFKVKRAVDIKRDAKAFEKQLRPLLRLSKELYIVDPYFDPLKAEGKYQPVLKAILNQHRHIKRVRIYVADVKYGKNVTSAAFEKGIKEMRLHPGIKLELYRLKEKDGGPKHHQRFLLTDIAGVQVDPGFDVETPRSDSPIQDLSGHEFNISLLTREQFVQRRKYYVDAQGFNQELIKKVKT